MKHLIVRGPNGPSPGLHVLTETGKRVADLIAQEIYNNQYELISEWEQAKCRSVAIAVVELVKRGI